MPIEKNIPIIFVTNAGSRWLPSLVMYLFLILLQSIFIREQYSLLVAIVLHSPIVSINLNIIVLFLIALIDSD